jgi:hypothetical protein
MGRRRRQSGTRPRSAKGRRRRGRGRSSRQHRRWRRRPCRELPLQSRRRVSVPLALPQRRRSVCGSPQAQRRAAQRRQRRLIWRGRRLIVGIHCCPPSRAAADALAGQSCCERRRRCCAHSVSLLALFAAHRRAQRRCYLVYLACVFGLERHNCRRGLVHRQACTVEPHMELFRLRLLLARTALGVGPRLARLARRTLSA